MPAYLPPEPSTCARTVCSSLNRLKTTLFFLSLESIDDISGATYQSIDMDRVYDCRCSANATASHSANDVPVFICNCMSCFHVGRRQRACWDLRNLRQNLQQAEASKRESLALIKKAKLVLKLSQEEKHKSAAQKILDQAKVAIRAYNKDIEGIVQKIDVLEDLQKRWSEKR